MHRGETVSHEGDQRNTQVMQSPGDCLVFLGCQLGVLLFSFGSMGLGGSCFHAVLHNVSHSATGKANLVVHMALMFLRCQFAVFAEFQRWVGGGFLLFRSTSFVLHQARVVLGL